MPRTRLHSACLRCSGVVLALWAAAAPGPLYAQAAPAAPQPPPPIWAGSVGAGLALTSGNADTTNINLAFKLAYDPRNPHLVKADALYLRGENEGDLTVNRSALAVRDEYALTERALLYGQFRYLRDTFKQINYLIAPGGGVGYKLVNLPSTVLAIDAGIGGVWENNPDIGTNGSGAINFGQNFSYKFSGTSTLTQSTSGLWKTSDFGDALYTVAVGVAASVTTKIQIKVELLETYKTLTPSPTVEKQDIALVTSLVYSL